MGTTFLSFGSQLGMFRTTHSDFFFHLYIQYISLCGRLFTSSGLSLWLRKMSGIGEHGAHLTYFVGAQRRRLCVM